MSAKDQFKLIFHGAADDSPETLRSVKTALVAALGFSAEEARGFFENAPCPIKAAHLAESLAEAEHVLERAGALVQVVSNEIEPPTNPPAEDENDDDNGVLIEFEVEQDEEAEPRPTKKKPPARVYSIADEANPASTTAPPLSKKDSDESGEIDELLTQISASSLLSQPKEDIEALVAKSRPPTPNQPAPTPPRPPPLAAQPLAMQLPQKMPPTTKKPPPVASEAPKKPKEAPLAPAPAKEMQPQPPLEPRKPPKLQFARDILYAAGLSLAIMAIGLWFLTEGGGTKRKNNLEKRLESIVADIQKESAKNTNTSSSYPDQKPFIFTEVTPQYSLNAKFIIENKVLTSLELELTTPPLPELTEQQILRGKTLPPWLQKLVLRDLHITQKPEGAFLATGGGKLFIRSNKGSERFVATAVVTGAYSDKPPAVTAKFLVNLGFKQLPKNLSFLFDQLPNGDYRFVLVKSIRAEKE